MPAFVLLSPSDLEQRSKQEMTLQPGWGLRERTLSKFLFSVLDPDTANLLPAV